MNQYCACATQVYICINACCFEFINQLSVPNTITWFAQIFKRATASYFVNVFAFVVLSIWSSMSVYVFRITVERRNQIKTSCPWKYSTPCRFCWTASQTTSVCNLKPFQDTFQAISTVLSAQFMTTLRTLKSCSAEASRSHPCVGPLVVDRIHPCWMLGAERAADLCISTDGTMDCNACELIPDSVPAKFWCEPPICIHPRVVVLGFCGIAISDSSDR